MPKEIKPLIEMPLHDKMNYYFRLQAMLSMMKRHIHCYYVLLFFLIVLSASLFHAVLTSPVEVIYLGICITAMWSFLFVVIPPRIQSTNYVAVATLLRDFPPPIDSGVPSLEEISRLLQSSKSFEHIISRWLLDEVARCHKDKDISRLFD